MTGRKGRVVSNDDGSISYESRSELDVPVEILNITEKQRFMDGDKVVLKEIQFKKNLLDAVVTLSYSSCDSTVILMYVLFRYYKY